VHCRLRLGDRHPLARWTRRASPGARRHLVHVATNTTQQSAHDDAMTSLAATISIVMPPYSPRVNMMSSIKPEVHNVSQRSHRNVTSAGWQVTLYDPILHVSSRSGQACCELLYCESPFTFTFTFTEPRP